MQFEKIKDELFKSFDDVQSRAIRGGYTVCGTNCSDTNGGSDASCSDHHKDEDAIVATFE